MKQRNIGIDILKCFAAIVITNSHMDTGQTHYIFYYILLFRFFIILLVITILPFVYVDYFSYLYKIY